MGPTKLYYLSATGDVATANGGSVVSVTLTPAAALSTLVLREGGSGGNIILAVQAAANGNTAQVLLKGATYTGQLHATLSGSGAVASIEL